MSLDIYLHCPCCGSAVMDKNITHNLTPMWEKAGVYDALYMSDGKLAGEYLDALERGIKDFEEHFDEYVALEPSNKWGTAEGALPWLKEVYGAFKANPTLKIHVSK